MIPHVQKKYLDILIESTRQRVLAIIFQFPDKEFSLSDLSNNAKVAKGLMNTILNELCKLELISINKLSKIWRIKANAQNPHFIKGKIIYNLNFLCQSGLIEHLDEKFKHPKAIILFGSFRKGDDISSSDIDIAIESDETEEYQTVQSKEFGDYEKIINRKIQIHLFNRKKTDLHVFNNIANGIVLSGFLEVKP